MSEFMRFSLIIPTLNRPETLKETMRQFYRENATIKRQK